MHLCGAHACCLLDACYVRDGSRCTLCRRTALPGYLALTSLSVPCLELDIDSPHHAYTVKSLYCNLYCSSLLYIHCSYIN